MTPKACLVLISLALCNFAMAVPPSPYAIEHRSTHGHRTVRETHPQQVTAYQYHIIPNDEYAVLGNSLSDLGIWDLINPTSVLNAVSSNASTIFKHFVLKGSLVILGVALVLGFCAFTPFCTLTIHKYPTWSHYYRAALDSSPLENIEEFLVKSLEKYNEIRDKKKK
ncbi:hypothetical protein EVAR_2893_1 [Eumeta japonica]|uniref:Uncharacterized protein n=1 Tax=Eumeta variegata TaxID=151549 RepID=A0A4C1T3R5_EUMVA|nr:hypothetical protein EVAR_2893_1 [Eumeta japonica]